MSRRKLPKHILNRAAVILALRFPENYTPSEEDIGDAIQTAINEWLVAHKSEILAEINRRLEKKDPTKIAILTPDGIELMSVKD